MILHDFCKKQIVLLPFLLLGLLSCSSNSGSQATGQYYTSAMLSSKVFDNVTVEGSYSANDGSSWSFLLENDYDKYHLERVYHNIKDSTGSATYDYLRDLYFCQLPYNDKKGQHALWVYYSYEGKKKDLSINDYSFSISEPSQALSYTPCGTLLFPLLSTNDGKDWLGMFSKASYDLMSKQYAYQVETDLSSTKATSTTTYSYAFTSSALSEMFYSYSAVSAGVALTEEISYRFKEYGNTYVSISGTMNAQNESAASSLFASSEASSSVTSSALPPIF